MKKFSKYSVVAALIVALGTNYAFAGVCDLVEKLGPVISTLRTLAFLGAAFVLMDWAWGFIQKGEVKKDELKDKGIGMFVGFFLLFGVGIVLQFVASDTGKTYMGCVEKLVGV